MTTNLIRATSLQIDAGTATSVSCYGRSSWESYEKILEALGRPQRVRVTYDRGDLEIMSPSANP